MVRLEQLLASGHTDLRAEVLAIRTALEVSGELRGKGAEPPVRKVSELTVAELNQLIEATRRELMARQWPNDQKQLTEFPPVAVT